MNSTTQPITQAVGLYLSVPFCKAKCTFCHFASQAFPPARMAAYTQALLHEINTAHTVATQHQLHLPRTADSLFLGGGTPSLLEPAQMNRILTALEANFSFTSHAERTVEAAPGQIEDELLAVLLRHNINRISLGVQSFVDAESRAVGRLHTAAQCLAEIERLRTAGISNLSLDLIAGLPHQTPASWAQSLHTAVASGVDHISVYMLEVDEDSRLGRELLDTKVTGLNSRYGASQTPGEALTAQLYEQACETLNQANYLQYEISNFARPGHQSQHNRKYWTRAPYLGFGLDAHSMLLDGENQATRFANTSDLDAYLTATELRDYDTIDQLAAFEETIFLGLRLSEGLSLPALRATYPAPYIDALETRTNQLAVDNLMRMQGDTIALTQQGRILSSSIFGELLASQLE